MPAFPPRRRPAPSDHFDGTLFHNPGTAAPRARGLRVAAKIMLARDPVPWPKDVRDPAFPPPPTAVADGHCAVTFIGHSTFLLRLPGLVVLTDPQFSERASPVSWAGPRRARPPGLALEALPKPDVVLVSHNHYDHMDLPSLRALRRRFAPRFVTAIGNARLLARAGIRDADELDWWEELALGAGPDAPRVAATPARHFSRRTLLDGNKALWCGFMLAHPAGRVLFAGDSAAGPHWRAIRDRLGAPTLALLPIGAYWPRPTFRAAHIDPAEAVQAHLDLGAAQSIGMHFGTFQLTDEAIDAPEADLARARDAADLAPDAFGTLGFGETRIYRLG